MSSIPSVEFIDYFVFVFGSEELSDDDVAFQNFDFAGDCYDKACRQLCLALKNKLDLDLNSTLSLAVSLCLNLAACSIKLQAFDGALIFCTMVLTFFPNNAKTLFRKVVALRHLNRISEASVTLKAARVIEPQNKDFIRELE
ncbi:uncharacterized protein LOC141613011 [Silene latifolia]|uniref:uncharacterized protein LOC141613011 n=1 Tax=Silene latifolia TaxID=37657 RepID=UPI003D788E41